MQRDDPLLLYVLGGKFEDESTEQGEGAGHKEIARLLFTEGGPPVTTSEHPTKVPRPSWGRCPLKIKEIRFGGCFVKKIENK